jgi:hypothetical protein
MGAGPRAIWWRRGVGGFSQDHKKAPKIEIDATRPELLKQFRPVYFGVFP